MAATNIRADRAAGSIGDHKEVAHGDDQKALLLQSSPNFIHVWKLERLFSSSPKGEGSWHHSPPFDAGGYGWKLTLHPMYCMKLEEEDDGERYWSLFLCPGDDTIAMPSCFVVETVLEISILNDSGNKHDKRKVAYKFRRGKAADQEEEDDVNNVEGGGPFLISLQTLKCPSSGFLVVEIPDASVHAEEVGASSPVPEEKKKMEYTWKIDGFSKLDANKYSKINRKTGHEKENATQVGGGDDQKALLQSSLNFIHVWKLERLFSSSPKGGQASWHHSPPFEAGGYRWKLALHPMYCMKREEEDDGERYWSLFLCPEDDAVPMPPRFVVETVLEISILNDSGNKHDKRKVAYKFRRGKADQEDVVNNVEGGPFLISLQTLKCPSSGFLVVEIPDASVHAEEVGASSPVPEEKKMEYIWKIDGFSKLDANKYKSGPFPIAGNIWYLTLFPKGNKNRDKDCKCVSLYLELDRASRLPPSEKVYADFGLSVVNQSHGIDLEERTNQHFSSEIDDWGFPNFLSLSDLHDPSKGFLVNDTCQVKVVFYSCNDGEINEKP